MDKRIGNQFRAVLFLFALVMFPVLGNISFSVGYFDLNGTQLKKVGAGVPFILEVTVTGNENVAEKPEIKQLNKFFYTAGGVQTSVQMINGIITAINRYSYQVRIDKPGTYELGPIEINHHGRMLRSKAFTITVIREQESTKKEVPDESEALISMSTNKEQCYTYEPVMLKMRIYARGDVQQVQPQLPETKGFSVSNPIGPTSGKTTLNGKEWDYHEIEMTLYPQTA